MRELEYLTFDELKIFALQLTDYHKYSVVKAKVNQFRQDKEQHRGEYKRFVNDIWTDAISDIHSDRIAAGRTRTRETRDASLKTFVKTQKKNMRDYADACFRYLRYTGLVSIAHKSRTISIFADKVKDVDFILSTVDRNPILINDVDSFKKHLFAANTPALYADNKDNIIDIILRPRILIVRFGLL